jgi:hypothetical protein
MSTAKSPLHAAGMHLAGVKRMGTAEQIARAEHTVAALWLERHIEEGIAKGLDRPTRQRLAKMLIAGGAQ